jgi:hypothetical protein
MDFICCSHFGVTGQQMTIFCAPHLELSAITAVELSRSKSIALLFRMRIGIQAFIFLFPTHFDPLVIASCLHSSYFLLSQRPLLRRNINVTNVVV